VTLILALDTSSASGSAALVRDGAIVAERDGDGARRHGERLPRELMTVLDEAAVSLRQIDQFAVVIGPGSFTGLRVGIATIQGLAMARRKLVTPVSAFEALASAASTTPALDPRSSTVIAVWIDARRGEVFATLYDADGRTTIEPPSSMTPEATLDAWTRALERAGGVRFAGDGAVRYAGIIRARLGDRAAIPERAWPLAGRIGVIAAAHPARAVAPHALVPLYVRRSDAELARDRRAAAKP
jgi:tRNA threonylcarbamoyladenosine biosynthesis protein TsaB